MPFQILPKFVPLIAFAAIFVFFSVIICIKSHFHRTLVTYICTELAIIFLDGNIIVCAGFSIILAAVVIRLLTSKEKKPPLEVKPIWMR